MKATYSLFCLLLIMQLVCISSCAPVSPITRQSSFRSGSSSPVSPHSPHSSGSTMNKSKAIIQKARNSIVSGAKRVATSAKRIGHELNHGDPSYVPHQVVGEGVKVNIWSMLNTIRGEIPTRL